MESLTGLRMIGFMYDDVCYGGGGHGSLRGALKGTLLRTRKCALTKTLNPERMLAFDLGNRGLATRGKWPYHLAEVF